jgi:hypothetical protein
VGFRFWAYRDLRQLIEFTGGLLLADDFIRELYVHMGFHRLGSIATFESSFLSKGI